MVLTGMPRYLYDITCSNVRSWPQSVNVTSPCWDSWLIILDFDTDNSSLCLSKYLLHIFIKEFNLAGVHPMRTISSAKNIVATLRPKSSIPKPESVNSFPKSLINILKSSGDKLHPKQLHILIKFHFSSWVVSGYLV